MTDSAVTAFVRGAKQLGYLATNTKGHYKIKDRAGKVVTTIPGSPSDRRWALNQASALRKQGHPQLAELLQPAQPKAKAAKALELVQPPEGEATKVPYGVQVEYPNGMTLALEQITPGQAQLYLLTQRRNRRLHPSHSDWLAQQLAAGIWEDAASMLAFDADGHLIDGQHRLNALVQAARLRPDGALTMTAVVLRGASGSVQLVMDSGKGRGLGDELGLRGVRYAPSVAALVTHVVGLQADTTGKGKRAAPLPVLLRAFDAKSEDYWVGIVRIIIEGITPLVRVRPSLMGAVIHLAEQAGEGNGRKWAKEVATGSDGNPDSPTLQLRLLCRRMQTMDYSPTARQLAALYLLSYNHWAAGLEGRLTFDTRLPSGEWRPLPRVEGYEGYWAP